MKKSRLMVIAVFLFVSAAPSIAQRGSVGIHITQNDYIGDLSNNKYKFLQLDFFKPGAAVSLQQYLNPSFNLVEMAAYNHIQWQNAAKTSGVDARFYNFNLMLKYKLNNGYILKETAGFAPYLIGGLGVANVRSKNFATGNSAKIVDGETKPNALAGGGIFIRFNDFIGLDLQSTLNRPFYDAWDGVIRGGNDTYLNNSAGLIFSLKKPTDTDKDGVPDKRDNCPNTPPAVKVDAKGCPIDTDQDGVADYIDKCPSQPGPVALNGCPDTDNDGIADVDDKCPSVPGIAKFAGCPDSDNDGVEDANDKCPNTPAGTPVDANGCPLDSDNDKVPDNLDKCPNTPAGTPVDANGCPIDSDGDGVPDNLDKCPNTQKGIAVDPTGCPLDSDGDGVPNTLDRCPNLAGPASNRGCPEVKIEARKRLDFARRGIFFDFDKATIKPISYPKLDTIVSVLNEYIDYDVRLGGHTDNIGTDEYNMKLSQDRIDAVRDYLVSKGIAATRLEAKGYGESKPIASNKTAAGRAKNRRVEIDLYLKD